MVQPGRAVRASVDDDIGYAHLDVFLSSFAASFALAGLIIGDECARSKHLLVTRTCLSVTAPQWSRFGPTTRVLMINIKLASAKLAANELRKTSR